MKARIKFRKYGALRFIGHLDVMRYFQKVMRRAEIPIAFTGGFSPHMIMSFASPLGIGLESDGEYLDIELTEPIKSNEAVRRMNEAGVEGIEQPADEAFGRISRPGYATEFTGYLFIDGLMEAVDRLGYDWEYDEEFVPQLTFAADGVRAEYPDAQEVTVIRPGGTEENSGGYGAYNPWFEYNSEDHLYYRFQDGEAQIDERTGEQLAVSNVILQYCHGEVRDSHDYLAFGVHGVGTALVFTDGKVIPASWSRMEGDGVPPKFYDADGNEIVFNQGKTWICNIWEEFSDSVEFE